MKQQETKKQTWGFVTTGHFPFHVLVSYRTPYQQLIDELNAEDYSVWAEACSHYQDKFNNDRWGAFAAWLNRIPMGSTHGQPYFIIHFNEKIVFSKRHEYDIIAHETMHIVQYVSDYVGADMIQEKESTAYLQQHLIKGIGELIKEIQKK